MKLAPIGLALALAGSALAQEVLPPPPPPPGDDAPRAAPGQAAQPSSGRATRDDRSAPRPLPATRAAPPPPGTIGEGPLAPAGSIGAPLHPDERFGNWKYSLSSGVVGRFQGYQLHTDQSNSSVLLYLGGQADGLWTEEPSRAARVRMRLFTGGERIVFLPSDGEVEGALAFGRREFRFVAGRVELARYTGLALQALVQVATLPSFEGSVSLASDKARLFYSVAPVELAWVSYFGRAHIHHSAALATETDHPDAATAGRLRVTFNVPPAVLLSLQGELLKLWGSVDLLKAAEASAGVAVLERSVLIALSMRWESYTRRDRDHAGAAITADQFLGMASATLVF